VVSLTQWRWLHVVKTKGTTSGQTTAFLSVGEEARRAEWVIDTKYKRQLLARRINALVYQCVLK